MDFKERLAAEIRRSGLTQKDLAAKVGVSKTLIGFWLRGTEPKRPQYERLLAVFPGLRDSAPASAEAAS